jgi:hypothetical protein
MTKNEQELIDIIRGSENPCNALMTAVEIICHYLEQRGSLPAQQVADLQESA